MSKKVLHLFDHSIPLQSGYTFRSRSILLQQRAMGYELRAITSNRQGRTANDQEIIDALTFYRTNQGWRWLEDLPLFKQWVTVSSLRKKLKQVIQQWRPEVIHAHSPLLTALAALPVCKRAQIPLIYEIRAFWEDAAVDHGTHQENSIRYRLIRRLETHICHEAAHITTICEGLKNDLITRGIASDKITVIPNAVDLNQFTEIADYQSKSNTGFPDWMRPYQLENCFVIGFIGSLYAYEGIDLAIEAFTLIKPQLRSAKLLIVGGGPQFAHWQQLAKQNPYAQDIIFTGRVQHNQVQDIYRAVQICLYPRKRMRLTDLVTPLKPLEAMAMGICVAASDVGGHRELIQHGKNGVLFQAGNANDLSQKLLMLKDPVLRQQLSANGRLYVETERNWPLSVARYQRIYADSVLVNPL